MTKSSQKLTNNLYKAILALQNLAETRRFMRDLLTEAEIREFSNRWQAAQMLDKKIPYTKVEKATGLSSTTVARVAKWLKRGMGGYRLMLKRQNHHGKSTSFGKGLP
ncbi:hypothetical protein KKI23_02715 [Patescibacteria group bacterium]|nr:hypothetical protein [Patescibacteria group bacterium]